jgi:hypothetical protein
LPGSKLERIDEWGFGKTGVKKITIPSHVEFIGTFCFSHCNFLCEVTFEGNVKVIEENAFSFCPLHCVKIPRGMKLNYEFPKTCRIE